MAVFQLSATVLYRIAAAVELLPGTAVTEQILATTIEYDPANLFKHKNITKDERV